MIPLNYQSIDSEGDLEKFQEKKDQPSLLFSSICECENLPTGSAIPGKSNPFRFIKGKSQSPITEKLIFQNRSPPPGECD